MVAMVLRPGNLLQQTKEKGNFPGKKQEKTEETMVEKGRAS